MVWCAAPGGHLLFLDTDQWRKKKKKGKKKKKKALKKLTAPNQKQKKARKLKKENVLEVENIYEHCQENMNCPTAHGNPVWRTVQMLGRLQLTTVGVPVLLQPTEPEKMLGFPGERKTSYLLISYCDICNQQDTIQRTFLQNITSS